MLKENKKYLKEKFSQGKMNGRRCSTLEVSLVGENIVA